MRTSIYLKEDTIQKARYLQKVTGRSFSSIIQESLDMLYTHYRKKMMLQNIKEEVFGKGLERDLDKVQAEIEEIRCESDRF